MKVSFQVLFFAVILNTCDIFAEFVKDVAVKFNNSNNNKKQISRPSNLTTNMRITPQITGKWHVGRVSRKQYEIINMLWKKTKIFVETEEQQSPTKLPKFLESTNKLLRTKIGKHLTLVDHNPIQESFQLAHPNSKLYSSTPSFIEFYYLDEFDERIRHRDSIITNKNKIITKSRLPHKVISGLSRSPLFLFRVNDATCKATTLQSFSRHFVKSSTATKDTKKKNFNHPKSLKTLVTTRTEDKNHDKYSPPRNSFMSNKKKYADTVASTSNRYKGKSSKPEAYHIRGEFYNLKTQTPKKSTANDRIRFFDIYDSEINTPYIMSDEANDKMINSNTILNEEKVNLYNVDHVLKRDDTNKTRYVKKHANVNPDNFKINVENLNDPTTVIKPNFLRPTATMSSQSTSPLWSEYPFVAVYVYEPTQVRCDSASISPHWLVASATCLNRHHKDIKLDGRSAYVAYCSGNWRHPGRIAYVKQSLLHPRFHPKDNSRRQLYNIGAIQIVNSMADTCSGWAPVSLMSHQFVGASGGTLATALGWGLDRYDTRYSIRPLPKYLTLYEGLVYLISCPGNIDYSKPRSLYEGGVRNVYCLSLTPHAEGNEATHGSLLLIGGKLVALYMQEDRRNENNHSSQFTGVWRLMPWLLEVAKEPEELDPFNLDI